MESKIQIIGLLNYDTFGNFIVNSPLEFNINQYKNVKCIVPSYKGGLDLIFCWNDNEEHNGQICLGKYN